MIAPKFILSATLLLVGLGEICGEEIMFNFVNPQVLQGPLQGALDLRNPQNGCIQIRPSLRRVRNRTTNPVTLNCVIVFDDTACSGARRMLETTTPGGTPANRRRNTLNFDPLSFRLCPAGRESSRPSRPRPSRPSDEDYDDELTPPTPNRIPPFSNRQPSTLYGAPSTFFNF